MRETQNQRYREKGGGRREQIPEWKWTKYPDHFGPQGAR